MLIKTTDVVRVRLTKAGEARYWVTLDERQARLIEHGGNDLDLHPADADGWREFQLWELMHDFGECLFNGGEQMFVDNVIELKGATMAELDAQKQFDFALSDFHCLCIALGKERRSMEIAEKLGLEVPQSGMTEAVRKKFKELREMFRAALEAK